MQEMLSSQIGAAGLSVYAIQWLKNTNKIAWVGAGTDKLNRVLSALLAALSVVGVSVQFDQTAGVLTISGLTVASVVALGWNWVTQFVFQEVIYRSAVKK
jgi:membrane-associated HD superfamily phosphohydrolase